MKNFATQIYIAVRDGRLTEPFNAKSVAEACPGQASKTYHVFLPKHRKGNPGKNTELFIRVAPGQYTVIRTSSLTSAEGHPSTMQYEEIEGIIQRIANRPARDTRPPDEIIGYDQNGLPS